MELRNFHQFVLLRVAEIIDTGPAMVVNISFGIEYRRQSYKGHQQASARDVVNGAGVFEDQFQRLDKIIWAGEQH